MDQLALAIVLLGTAGAGGGYYWWQQSQDRLPPGIASGNGRLEADEIDIDTKFAGRIANFFVDEGDMVAAGQVVAMMDTRESRSLVEEIRGAGEPGAARARRGEARTWRSSRPRSRWRSSSSTAPVLSCPKGLCHRSSCSISGVNK